MNIPTSNNKNYNNNNKKTIERLLILRVIRYNNKYVAFILINSYDIKNKIESMFAKPATAFIRYENFKNIIENDDDEKDNFKNMCNKNVENENPTENLYFLTSLKDNEISQMNLKKNFVGFQLITSLGLNNINIDKFNKDSLNYEKTLNSPIIENMLDKELNETAEKLHSYLKNYCQLTLTTPIETEYNKYYYKLIVQRRVLNFSGFEKFKQVLNLGTKIHRFSIANNNVMENNDTL